MGRKATGNPPGRPKKNFNKKVFESACACWCTEEEICAKFNTDDMTLNRWCKETYGVGFSEIYKQKMLSGVSAIRSKQLQVALSGNVTMLIWLGKQKLGQTEKQEQVVSVITDDTRLAVEELIKGLDEDDKS
jgi:hypothetical protein